MARVSGFLQAAAPERLPSGYGLYLLQTLLGLAAVCVLAYVLLRWAARRVYGAREGSRVRVIERTPLEPRRTLYLVEAAGRVLLIGSSEGQVTLLTEIDPKALPPPPPARRFADVLKGALGRPATPAPKEPDAPR